LHIPFPKDFYQYKKAVSADTRKHSGMLHLISFEYFGYLESGGRFSFGALMLDQWWYIDTSGVSLLRIGVVFYFSFMVCFWKI